MRNVLLISLFLASCVSHKAPEGDPIVAADKMLIEAQGEGDVIAMGDFGTGTPDQYAVGKAMAEFCAEKSCDLGITMGDNFYPIGVKSVDDPLFQSAFEVPYKDVKFTFYPTLGNHDYYGDYLAQINYSSPKWVMPYRYYKVETKLVDFFALDTEHFTTTEYLWLQQGLKDSKARWRVIYGHRPIYSSGIHGDTTAIAQYVQPLLSVPGYGADFYIGGHDHHLELIERDGRIHIVTGAAGKLRSVKGGDYSVFAASKMGFTYIDFSEDKAEVFFIGKDKEVLFQKAYAKTDNIDGIRLKQESFNE